ncbi:hypothetical protein CO230_01570 [Chryseobacterium sp. 6424]|uniref:hypothetical protein n=1 Tax=Chryseobacterium sp. 6424 TaxID=2039166 RepID=UPI000EFC8280|nr:hypothetical protein [Chryseobacterium sp. 6424]AYO56930.1 hypothetical protein CO230_01570 [Chryseobacterium sp. 6424]
MQNDKLGGTKGRDKLDGQIGRYKLNGTKGSDKSSRFFQNDNKEGQAWWTNWTLQAERDHNSKILSE